MFVKHIEDKDIFECGFTLNPLFNETFSMEKVDRKFISTYMQVWVDINSYRYKVVTDREGVIEYGTVFSKEILKGLVSKFFTHDRANFLRRNLPKLSKWDDKTISMISSSLQRLPQREIDNIMLNNFGENYE